MSRILRSVLALMAVCVTSSQASAENTAPEWSPMALPSAKAVKLSGSLGESLAHLHALVSAGRLAPQAGADGVWRFAPEASLG